ncbi:hypothetical protein AMATHDRAFT_67758 [Amanita thiersii Skay4041]|uniref:Uncharacterized protein n=1 Tax=Amanita thiersii Skay4041 TaxID=703135 RepID=A0A2A9NIC9_9AGAR|nr:hypothetical protein AMATHDRAFT_67758 [Amanita thiersii Skay4041]
MVIHASTFVLVPQSELRNLLRHIPEGEPISPYKENPQELKPCVAWIRNVRDNAKIHHSSQ